MVSAAKILGKEPPHEPLTDCGALYRDFQWRFEARHMRDQVVDFCQSAPNLRTAVRRACVSRAADGKMHNHQSRVWAPNRKALYEAIMDNIKFIVRSVRYAENSNNYWWTGFDQLHDSIERLEVRGIGPVTVYDVSVRVGAYMGIEPKSLYLHAGVRAGAKALLGADTVTSGVKRLPLSMLPKPLCDLDADLVEDIICTYREIIEQW